MQTTVAQCQQHGVYTAHAQEQDSVDELCGLGEVRSWVERSKADGMRGDIRLLPERQGFAYPDTAHRFLVYTLINVATHEF